MPRRRDKEVPEKYREAIAKVKAAREEAQKMAAQAFQEGIKDLFDTYPNLQTIGWTQYTPYFCDGDPCVFRTNSYEGEIFVNGLRPGYDDEEGDGEAECEALSKAENDAIQAAVAEFVGVFADEDLQNLFGEGKVTINRDGTSRTDDYEHD